MYSKFLKLIKTHIFHLTGYAILWIKSHEDFGGITTFFNDIAIITLQIPLNLSDPDLEAIAPISTDLKPKSM